MIVFLAAIHALAAPPEAVANLVADPADPARRLAFGRALATTPGDEEDAVEVLHPLLPDPSATDALTGVLSLRARPGWEPIYVELLKTPDVPRRALLRLRLAEIRAGGVKTRAAALAELRKLAAEGQAAEATAALLRVGDLAGARATGGETVAGFTDPSLPRADRAASLLRSGYPASAVAVLTARSSAPLSAGEQRTLADARRLTGDPSGAARAMAAALRLAPDDAGLRVETARAQLEAWQFAEAQKTLGDPGHPLAGAIEARRLVAAARATKSTADDAPAFTTAHGYSPEDPVARAAYAELAITDGRPADALADLEAAAASRPGDRGILGRLSQAAIAAKRPGVAIEPMRAAVASAPTAKDRAVLADELANLRVLEGEAQKAAGRNAEGRAPYAFAVATRPHRASVLVGAAGLWWQDQRPDTAYQLYRAALVEDPKNVDALLSAVVLALNVGRDADAVELLARAPDKEPRVKLLRLTVDRAMRARDARAAVRTGDLATAEAEWRKLTRDFPGEPEFLHGLADALAGLGRFDDALAVYREARRSAPADPWIRLGEANCLVALGRAQEAREFLADFPADAPPAALVERDRVLARSWRATGDAARAAGDNRGAFDAYAEALALDPEQWVIIGLGALYLDNAQPEVAEAFYLEALELDPGNALAERGLVSAMEGAGHDVEALARAEALVASQPTEANRSFREALNTRVAVRRAERLRLTGQFEAAEELLAAALVASPSADAWSALGAVRYSAGDARGALDAVAKALTLQPQSGWARGVALQAARSTGQTRKWLPTFEAAAATGDALAQADLAEARLDAELEDAHAWAEGGRVSEAAAALRRAETLADEPDDRARVGAVWLSLHRPAEARANYARALQEDPQHVESIVGVAGAMWAQEDRRGAEMFLKERWTDDADPQVGLMLARVRASRGFIRAANDTLDEVRKHRPKPTRAKEPVVVRPEPYPILPLPSGRKIRPPEPPPPLPDPVEPEWYASDIELLTAQYKRDLSPHGSVTAGLLHRPGTAGEQQILAVYTPILGGPAPIGLVRIDLEATPVWLDDGRNQEFGVAPTVGVASPAYRRVYGEARVGMSPIGFTGNPYVTFSGHLRSGFGQDFALGGMVNRAPVAHSLTSWAGAVDPVTGQLFGRVSELWGGLYGSYTPASRWDLGAFVRGGYTEGIGVEPNPLLEAIGWGGRTIGDERGKFRFGLEGVFQTNERQEDQFVPGEGGYFSPPLFVVGALRLDASHAFAKKKARICASGSGGVQHMEGRPTPQFGAGTGGVFSAKAGIAWRISPRWAFGADGGVQLTTDGWHQEGGGLKLSYGLLPSAPGAPQLTTFASPGSLLLAGDTCSAD